MVVFAGGFGSVRHGEPRRYGWLCWRYWIAFPYSSPTVCWVYLVVLDRLPIPVPEGVLGSSGGIRSPPHTRPRRCAGFIWCYWVASPWLFPKVWWVLLVVFDRLPMAISDGMLRFAGALGSNMRISRIFGPVLPPPFPGKEHATFVFQLVLKLRFFWQGEFLKDLAV